jgi:dihydroorotate dehydrogenase
LYRLLRPLLFLLDAEAAHRFSFALIGLFYRLPGFSRLVRLFCVGRARTLPVEVMGIALARPVGLAAGLDKNAELAPFFADLGFGFVELGTVTPRPQAGNPRPRLFRLRAARALINRMGFNNAGLAQFLDNLYRLPKRGPVGINIGRNKDTPNEQALDDYRAALRAVYAHADYVTINISSPNTPGLRALQEGGQLEALLSALKHEQTVLAQREGRRVPLALKIAPDLDSEQIAEIARVVLAHGIEGVIATNTTIARPGLEQEPVANEPGGLSGRPLRAPSTGVIRELYRHLQGRAAIIGVGGIENADDAWEKLVAGADAVQVYTAFIYEGPALVRRIVRGLDEKVRVSGAATLAEAVAKARTAATSPAPA